VEARALVRRWAHEHLPEQVFNAQNQPSFSENASPQIIVTLHPEPACAFLGPSNEYLLNLEKSLGMQIWLQAETNFHQEAITIEKFDPSLLPVSPRQPLQVGATITVPIQLARFPQKDPLFIAWNKRLVLLENIRQLQSHTKSTFQMSITTVGRWYATGHVLEE
jgi:hypothetical protein